MVDQATMMVHATYSMSATAVVASGATASGGLHSLVSPFVGRQTVIICNNDASENVYVGFQSDMDDTTGWIYKLASGERAVLQVNSGINPYLHAAAGAPPITVVQLM